MGRKKQETEPKKTQEERISEYAGLELTEEQDLLRAACSAAIGELINSRAVQDIYTGDLTLALRKLKAELLTDGFLRLTPRAKGKEAPDCEPMQLIKITCSDGKQVIGRFVDFNARSGKCAVLYGTEIVRGTFVGIVE